jgi:hypothetical protein
MQRSTRACSSSRRNKLRQNKPLEPHPAAGRNKEKRRNGENVGLLLRGVDRDEVVRGQVIIAPGSVKSHVKAKAELFVIPTKEGGRHTPILKGYKPQFFGTTDVTGSIVDLQPGMQMINPATTPRFPWSCSSPSGWSPACASRFARAARRSAPGSSSAGAGHAAPIRR